MSTEMQARLEANENVRVNELDNGIRAYNFTRKTFWDQLWDEDTMTARGLFMRDGEIVARGFNKFFNLGEPYGYTREQVLNDFEYPVVVEDKLNGYLVVVSVIDGEVRVFSKSGETDYSVAAQTVLPMKGLTNNVGLFEGYSLVFEVILSNDPHIVAYDKDHVVLLAAIENSEEYNLDDDTRDRVAIALGILRPERVIAHNAAELEKEIDNAISSTVSEGVVIRDAAGRATKIKSDWYTRVKRLRRDINRYRKNGEVSDDMVKVLESVEARGITVDDLFVESVGGGVSINLPYISDDWK